MPAKNSSAAITSPLALDEYAKAVEKINYHAYLLMHLILETGIHLKKALELTVTDMQTSLEISANGKNYYFNNQPISEKLYQSLLSECKLRKKNELYFLHANKSPLTKQGFRTVLEDASTVNPSYQLNSLTLRKTYYWGLYNRSTNRNELLKSLQLYSEQDAASYFGVPLEVIAMKSGNSSRAQIFSSSILSDTFEKLENTVSTIKEEYASCMHSDAYYDALRVFMTSLDCAVTEYLTSTKDIF